MWHRRLGKGCGAVLLGADLACKPASEAREGGGEQCSPGKAATGCGFRVARTRESAVNGGMQPRSTSFFPFCYRIKKKTQLGAQEYRRIIEVFLQGMQASLAEWRGHHSLRQSDNTWPRDIQKRSGAQRCYRQACGTETLFRALELRSQVS